MNDYIDCDRSTVINISYHGNPKIEQITTPMSRIRRSKWYPQPFCNEKKMTQYYAYLFVYCINAHFLSFSLYNTFLNKVNSPVVHLSSIGPH